jgi:sugar transferase (PEP-CTERM system associated)
MVLAGVEAALIAICLHVALAVLSDRPLFQGYHIGQNLTLAVSIIFVMEIMGLYDREVHAQQGARGLDDILRLLASLLLTLIAVTVARALVQLPLPPTETLLVATGLIFVVLAGERQVYRRISVNELFARRILVLGSGSRAVNLETSNALAQRPYKILAFVAVEPQETLEVPESRIIALEQGQSLLSLARSMKAEEIVVAVRDRRGSLPIRQLLECKLQGITITEISAFFEREYQRLDLQSMNTSWLVFGSGFRQNWLRNFIKRFFDIALSLLLVILTLPIMLFTAVAVRLDSPGPTLYWQTRVGRGNTEFAICKFRSMRQDAEQSGTPQWAASNDARITRVGRVIRKLRIDELPQIFNVLKGEMSFIGPRPERPIFVEQLSNQIPYFLARHSIRPGISGWAQVRYPYGASVEDAKEKLQYDLYYVKNHTLFLDILILLETIKVVLFGRGAR